jgi:hypothetical protein
MLAQKPHSEFVVVQQLHLPARRQLAYGRTVSTCSWIQNVRNHAGNCPSVAQGTRADKKNHKPSKDSAGFFRISPKFIERSVGAFFSQH